MFDNLMIDNSFYTALIVFFAQLKRQGREKDLCTLKRFDFFKQLPNLCLLNANRCDIRKIRPIM